MNTKHCPRCKEDLPKSSFTKSASRKDGLQAYCSVCMKKYRREHYNSNKQQYYDRNNRLSAVRRQSIVDIKNTTPCTDCGVIYKDEPWLTEFDHVRGEKKMQISSMVYSGWSQESIEKELDKCELVCLICHRRRTALRGGWLVNRFEYMLE